MRKRLFLRCGLAALGAAGFAVPAVGQETPDEINEEERRVQKELEETTLFHPVWRPHEGLKTITVTAASTQVSKSGASVSVVDVAEILDVQGADLSRVIQRLPGVTFSRNGGIGAFSGLRVRGAEAEQTLVYVDGVKLTDPAAPTGGFDFGNLTTGNVAKIELLRSANSTIWGSDAIGGVMVVSTRGSGDIGERASRVSGRPFVTKTGGVFVAEYGSDNALLLSAAGGRDSRNATIGASASYYSSDGFSAAAGGTEADGFEQFAINGGGSVRPTDSLEIFANARYAEGELEIDGFPFPTFSLSDTDEFQKTTQFSAAAGARLNTGSLDLQLSYSLADTARDNFNPAFGTDPSFTSNGRSDRIALRGNWSPDLGILQRVSFGAENEWLEYETLFDAGDNTRIFGAYTQLGFEVNDLRANVGVRHDDHARFGGATSFGADAVWDISDFRLHASLGEGFKAPSLFQLFSDFGNEALRPEKSTGFDFGISRNSRGWVEYAGVTFFRRDTENLIEFISCFGSTDPICTNRPFGTYNNIGKTRAQGVEIEAGTEIADALRLRATYSFIDTENRTVGSPNEGNRLARRPRHVASFSADWLWHDSVFAPTLGVDVRYSSSAFDDAANAVRLDDYAVMDVRLVVPVLEISSSRQNTLDAFARIENVWDEQYQTAAGFGTQGRAMFVGLRASL